MAGLFYERCCGAARGALGHYHAHATGRRLGITRWDGPTETDGTDTLLQIVAGNADTGADAYVLGGVAQSCERVAAWAFVDFCWLPLHTATFSLSGHYVASFRLFLGGLHASILGRSDFSISRLWILVFFGGAFALSRGFRVYKAGFVYPRVFLLICVCVFTKTPPTPMRC